MAVLLLMQWLPPDDNPAAEAALPVGNSLEADVIGENFARLTVVSEDEISLEQVWVLVNGQAVGSLASGRLPVRVYDGDRLSLDCRAYGRELTFYLVGLSANIDPNYLQLTASGQDELVPLGFIVIRQL